VVEGKKWARAILVTGMKALSEPCGVMRRWDGSKLALERDWKWSWR